MVITWLLCNIEVTIFCFFIISFIFHVYWWFI